MYVFALRAGVATAAFLMTMTLGAHAEENGTPLSPEAFNTRLLDTADKAGNARLPVACGGLFRALRSIADDGTKLHTELFTLERDMAFFGTVMQQKQAGGDMDTALDAVVPHVQAVSALYLTRMSQNRKASGGILDPVVSGNFEYCQDLNDRLLAQIGTGDG